ncbi:MAG: hypothetical protein DWQ07_18765 [Chloroflexi bacterium]|nr:MAG: hypothetical protein DWQ07_18765 [Chloroflexota bacterium]MBL1194975.1 hypothetical protein [Chloroflexota bacterium]
MLLLCPFRQKLVHYSGCFRFFATIAQAKSEAISLIIYPRSALINAFNLEAPAKFLYIHIMQMGVSYEL